MKMPEFFRHFDQALRYFDQTQRFCNSEFSILHHTQNLGAFSLRPFDQTQRFFPSFWYGVCCKNENSELEKLRSLVKMPHGRFILIKLSYIIELVSSCTIQSTKPLLVCTLEKTRSKVFNSRFSILSIVQTGKLGVGKPRENILRGFRVLRFLSTSPQNGLISLSCPGVHCTALFSDFILSTHFLAKAMA